MADFSFLLLLHDRIAASGSSGVLCNGYYWIYFCSCCNIQAANDESGPAASFLMEFFFHVVVECQQYKHSVLPQPQKPYFTAKARVRLQVRICHFDLSFLQAAHVNHPTSSLIRRETFF